MTDANNSTGGAALVGYVSDPDGRGTPTLLISCLVTLILCVWSAVHLNVPQRGETRVHSAFVTLRWVVAGIYAPELVVFAAWRQWSSARILQRIVEDELRRGDTDMSANKRRFPWTMAHSFFACSGGFAFELQGLTNSIHERPEMEGQHALRLTITARGIALLARCRRLPDIEAEQIEDKSKANDLAKTAVLVQATWMLVQVLGRLASRLPVTLLEVNTVAHVLCAFLMYAFWWHKPLLPEHPIVLHDNSLAPLAAFMYSSSQMSGYVNPRRVKSKTIVKTFFAYLRLYSKTPELENICLHSHGESFDFLCGISDGGNKADSPSHGESAHPRVQSTGSPSLFFREAPASCVAKSQAMRGKEISTAFFERRPQVNDQRPRYGNNFEINENRWHLMSHAVGKHPGLLKDRILLAHTIDETDASAGSREDRIHSCLHIRSEELVADKIQNWPGSDLLHNVGGLVVGMVLWLANLCYGAIHAAAWNDHFPSKAEMWLWRASASYIAFCGGLWVVLNFTVTRIPGLNRFWDRWMDGEKTGLQSFGLGLVVVICGFSLFLARIYVVVEAFVSIRELPAGAYVTPEWTNIFPHF